MRIPILLATVMALSWAAPSFGQDYNPASPAEPGMATEKVRLYTSPPEGGSVSGAGSYIPGSQVNIHAMAAANYSFLNWTDSRGDIVSESSVYTFYKADGTEKFTANFVYNPGSPAEPPATGMLYKLTVTCSEGGSAGGGGLYCADTEVWLSASTYPDYRFLNWTGEDGTVYSTSPSFSYQTKDRSETIRANFVYSPATPYEPDDMSQLKRLTLVCGEGGTCTPTKSWGRIGENVFIQALPNPGYVFDGWYIDGVLYSLNGYETIQIGDEDVVIEARFRYNPDAPYEPEYANNILSLYLMSEITYPGTRVACPVFISGGAEVGDMRFNLAFPPQALPDWTTAELYGDAQGYTLTVQDAGEEGVYTVTLTGSTLTPVNMPLFTVLVDVPETVPCGDSYQIKVNQVSMTGSEGETFTARTRNGRVYVYELGDNNGDGKVDLLDYVNMCTYLLTDGQENEVFIQEVSDVNEDGKNDLLDTVNILELLLQQ